jgi:hypothetical protein
MKNVFLAIITILSLAPVQAQDKDSKAELRDKWGIEVTSLRLTANNHMLDFRYKVLNKEKAAPIFDRDKKPYLIHENTGKALTVPAPAKIGPLRNSDSPKPDRIYWMFFGNAGKLIKKGDLVTVVIGDFRAEELLVEQ